MGLKIFSGKNVNKYCPTFNPTAKGIDITKPNRRKSDLNPSIK